MEKNKVTRDKPLGILGLSLLSVLIGMIAGLGAAVFRGLIAFFHNLLFLGKLSLVFNANAHTPPGPWGPFVILVPVVGALGVAFLVKNFAPEAKGHGVPEVMDAIYYNKGIIRPIVALVKSLASALSIGSGGAIGREGPIIQIGSSFGSSVGQILKMPVWQRITLISAGAGGGIAATFNTPIGGVLFAVEIMLHEVSARTLIPVAISTATATYVGRIIFGSYPSFVQTILNGELSSPYLILILFALKLLATSLTLGSGASGGIFSPALFVGATLGGAYGILLHRFFPGLAISPPAFAVAGMAGMVGGTTGAAMAAIVMIFEMTLDYDVIIPMTLTVALSYGIRKSLCSVSLFLMEDLDRVIGVLANDMAIKCMGPGKTVPLHEIVRKDFVTVSEEATLFYILARMRSKQASVALVTKKEDVVSPDDVKGVITRQQIGDAMMQGIEMFAD